MIKNSTIDLGATLYDMNKQLIKTECKPLTHLQLAQKQEELKEWFKNIVYAMLLCHDIRYFTVFALNNGNLDRGASNAAIECIGCLTDQKVPILSIDKQEDNSWEIWLQYEDEPKVFYLFDYKQGVIEC